MGEKTPLLAAKSVVVVNGIGDETNKSIQLAPLTSSDYILIILLAVSSFTVNLCFALLVTFFPEEAVMRGAQQWQIGFIFSIFELGCFLFSPLYGKYMIHIGSKFLFVSGIACLSYSTVLFGTLAFSLHGLPFVLLSLSIRLVQGISAGAQRTALLTIVANQFPTRVATMMSIIESSTCVAFLVGPLVGGLLYQVGGFLVPFVVTGSLNLSIVLMACLFLPPQQDDAAKTSATGSVFPLLTVPGVWMPLGTILSATITMAFVDLTLAQQMDTFGISTAMKGVLFSVLAVMEAVALPLWGKLSNKKGYGKLVMVCGAFITGVALLLIGPFPAFKMNESLALMIISLLVLGIGVGAQYISPFIQLLHTVKQGCYADDLRTDGLVAGLMNFFSPLGAFIGSSVGGFVNEAIGFSWSTAGLALIEIFLGLGILLHILQFGTIINYKNGGERRDDKSRR